MKPASLTRFGLTILLLALLHGTAQAQFPHHTPPGYTAPVYDQYVMHPPHDRYQGPPLEQFLRRLTARSWMRIEYMHLDLEEPGRVFLGAPVDLDRGTAVGGNNLDVPFEVFDSASGATRGLTVVPDLENFTLNDTTGVRGTYGIPFMGGSFEINFWGTEQSSDVLDVPDIRGTREQLALLNPLITLADPAQGTVEFPNLATTLLVNGAVTNSAGLSSIIYDQSFFANLDSQVWGTEANIFIGGDGASQGITWEPLFGVRLINLQEELSQRGVFNSGGTVLDQVTTIYSKSTNNAYGPQIGARLSAKSEKLELSATPRIAFALNNYSNNVISTTPASIVAEAEKEVDFTTIFQVSFQARIHCNDRFTLFGGYDFLWAHRLTRAFNNIDYDSSRDVLGILIPDIGLRSDFEKMVIRGFSFGGELRF